MKAKNSREAVHWKVYERAQIGDIVAAKPTATIACGRPVEFRPDMWTEMPLDVTCKDCAELARKAGFKTQLPDEPRMF